MRQHKEREKRPRLLTTKARSRRRVAWLPLATPFGGIFAGSRSRVSSHSSSSSKQSLRRFAGRLDQAALTTSAHREIDGDEKGEQAGFHSGGRPVWKGVDRTMVDLSGRPVAALIG